MAINPATKYPLQTEPASTAFPYGKAQNVTVSGDGLGTPWEKDLVNDLFGFQQSLLKAAGIIPSGTPDKVGGSQYLQALFKSLGLVRESYTTLRLVESNLLSDTTSCLITNNGVDGFFKLDKTDTTTPDDSGAIIVDADGGRWKRVDISITNVKWFGAVGDGTTDDNAAVQAAINSLTLGGKLYFPKGTYKLTGLTVTVDNIFMYGNSTLDFPILGTSSTGIDVAANNFEIDELKFTGPADDVFVSDEIAIKVYGVSAASRKSGLVIRNCEFNGFGGYCLYAEFMDHTLVSNNYAHNIGGAGFTFFSCNDGKFLHNKVVSIVLNGGGNAYGVSLTHDSTLWPGDMTTSPYCRDWLIDGNWVEDIDWEGIDTHGCERITVVNNKLYDIYGGIAVTTSSNAAAPYAGEGNIISNNYIDARHPDGTVSGRENVNYGININGGTTTQNTNVVVSGNILNYQGDLNNSNSGAIQATFTNGVSITGNVIENWGGNGVNANNADDVVISGNNFKSHASAETGGYCVNQSIAAAHKLIITGNTLDGPNECIRCSSTVPPVVSGNNIKGATQLLKLTTDGNYSTGDVSSSIETNASDATTIDVANKPDTAVIFLNYSTPITITNLTNARIGQTVTLINLGSNAVIFDRTTARLDGSVNWAGTLRETLTIIWLGSEWFELSRTANG